MKKTPLKIVHVNQHVIKHNRKTGQQKPAITAKYKYKHGHGFYSNHVAIVCDGKVVARVCCEMDKPLSCGAVCWIETQCELIDEDASGSKLL